MPTRGPSHRCVRTHRSHARAARRNREQRDAKKAAAAAVEVMKPSELRNLVFEKFQEQRFWNRKELEQATGQKAVEVKKVLDQVAERIAVGPHKGEFQLKAEYRES